MAVIGMVVGIGILFGLFVVPLLLCARIAMRKDRPGLVAWALLGWIGVLLAALSHAHRYPGPER